MTKSNHYIILFFFIIGVVSCNPYKQFSKTPLRDFHSYIVTNKNDTLYSIRNGKVEFIGAKIFGTYHEIYANGKIKFKVGVNNGFFNGAMIIYNPDGKLFAINEYSHGKLKGWIYLFDENGCLKESKFNN